MAVIYLRHPVHGVKVATMDMEAEYDERNGWQRYTPGVEDDPDDAPPPVNALGRRRRKEVQNGYHGG